jgi:hypothetical protein
MAEWVDDPDGADRVRGGPTYSGGTAPAFHRLPFYAPAGTEGTYSIVRRRSIHPRRGTVKGFPVQVPRRVSPARMRYAAQMLDGPSRPPAVPAGAVFCEETGEWEIGARDAEGRRHGPTRAYRRDGTLASEHGYLDGLLEGRFRRFHPDGTVAREGTFRGGKPHGRVVAAGSTSPSPELLQSCCVPRTAWRLETDFDEGVVRDVRWYDRAGVHILPSGNPHPLRPDQVPAEARYDEEQQRWILAAHDPAGRADGVWRRWSETGTLRERDEHRAGQAHGLSQRWDSAGTLVEESTWRDGRRDGLYRRVAVPPGRYQDPRVHEERGVFAQDEPVGRWSLHDRAGGVVRELDLGVPADEPGLTGSPALADVARAGEEWEQQARALEAAGRPGEALLAAARAAAVAGDVAFLRSRHARLAPALTGEAARDLAADAVKRAGGRRGPLVSALARGGDVPALLRALASVPGAAERVALALVDAALLMAPDRHECRTTRALILLQLGRPDDARADAAALPADWGESRAFIETYARIIFPEFAFWPATTDIRTQLTDVPPAPEQPLETLREQAQKYATRLRALRGAVAQKLGVTDGGPERPPPWLPPDLLALLPDGPAPLDAWEFEEIVIDDDGPHEEGSGGAEAAAAQPAVVTVDERLELGDPGTATIPALMRAARREWNALCWLCWSAGLDRVALPDAVRPPPAFGHAAAMSVERLWRCRDKLSTAGLRALTQHVPGFTWEGIEIDDLPPVLVEIARDEHLELRALFFWLCDAGVQSPWQDNLRAQD